MFSKIIDNYLLLYVEYNEKSKYLMCRASAYKSVAKMSLPGDIVISQEGEEYSCLAIEGRLCILYTKKLNAL